MIKRENILQILREYTLRESSWDEEEESKPIPDSIKEKFWRKFESAGIVPVLKPFEDSLSEEQLHQLIKGYLEDYKDRKDYYLDVFFGVDTIADLFSVSDYGLDTIVKNMFSGEYDYDYYNECWFDDYQLYHIDTENWIVIKELMQKSIESGDYEYDEELSEKDNLEIFAKEELQSEIGCAHTEAQHSADIDALHSDLREEIDDYYSNVYSGNLVYDWQDNVKESGWKGNFEISELLYSPMFDEALREVLGYPIEDFDWEYLYEKILEYEEGSYFSVTHFIPEKKPNINEDKHFRYGGAGDIDYRYFNEILQDKLQWV